MTSRICPHCKGTAYSAAETQPAWICPYCKKPIPLEQEAKICAGGCIRNYAEPLEHCDGCIVRKTKGEK